MSIDPTLWPLSSNDAMIRKMGEKKNDYDDDDDDDE